MSRSIWTLIWILSSLFSTLSSANETEITEKPFRIAVIGSGVGGSTIARRLHEMSSAMKPVELIVFEQNDRIGGRVLEFEQGELGASIFITANRYMMAMAERYNMTLEKPLSAVPR